MRSRIGSGANQLLTPWGWGYKVVKAAFQFLMGDCGNPIYKEYVRQHELILEAHGGEDPKTWRWIPTHELLLSSPGIEVAARPWLYIELHLADSREWRLCREALKGGFEGRL